MIVLDATTKSLVAYAEQNNVIAGALLVTITYWSVDASNVWTPNSSETVVNSINASVTPGATTTILSAPGAGSKKVVENVWFHVATSGMQDIQLILKDSATEYPIGWFSDDIAQIPIRTIFTMSRDGSWIRQWPYIAGGEVTPTQNIR